MLAPAFDDPARATYLRWILFGPSVIEPLVVELQNKGSDFAFKPNEKAIVHAVSCISSAGADAASVC